MKLISLSPIMLALLVATKLSMKPKSARRGWLQ